MNNIESKKQNEILNQSTSFHQREQHRSWIITSLKAKKDAQRSAVDIASDSIRNIFGSMPFLVINVFWFVLWIVVNLGLVPLVQPFDPFPFGLLTMIVSLEAIILATFVLISQNRAARIDDLREEIDLQLDVIAEKEITKVMEIVALIAKKNGIDLSNDEVLIEMLKPIDTNKIERTLQQQIT
jgi:uncharacterized membrane protein